MLNKFLNNFRGRNRPTQVLVVFLVFITVMSIMNRMKESKRIAKDKKLADRKIKKERRLARKISREGENQSISRTRYL